jgi:chromosome segregation ATPase
MQTQRQALQEERAALSWLLQALQGCARDARGGFDQVVGRLAQAEAQQAGLAGSATHAAARAAEAELQSLRERLRATQRERGAALGRADALEAEVAKLREVGIRLDAREQVLHATQGSLTTLQRSSRAELAAAAERTRAAEAAAEAAAAQQAAAARLAREELGAMSAARVKVEADLVRQRREVSPCTQNPRPNPNPSPSPSPSPSPNPTPTPTPTR